jgi:16S rRNA processing protein RimM
MSSKSSKTEAPPSPAVDPRENQRDDLPETISVGRVLRPHGVRGEVVVEVLSDVPGRFKKGSRVTGVREGAPPLLLTVATGRVHKSGAVVRFEGYDSRERAEELRALDLEIPRSEVPKAKRGTYYHFELLGCRVHSVRDGGQELGRVVEVVEDGGGVMLIVEGEGRRVPVPFVKEILRKVDVAAGRIDVVLPEGLLEACASLS